MADVSEIVKKHKEDTLLKKHDIVNDNKRVTQNQKQEEIKKQHVENLLKDMTEEQKEIMRIAIAKRKARENYFEYVKYCYPEYTWTPFHKFLCMVIDSAIKRVERANRKDATEEDIRNGKVRILLSVPPRHGKTETVTKTAPSWFIGRNPTKHAILTAYNSEMAEKFNDSNRQKVREKGAELFGVKISDSQDNKGLFELKQGGACMGVGIQAGITGNGGELIIIDDPYKNSVEANSPATRKMVEDIYRDSIYTRLQGRGNALIVIQTRWHEDDLYGMLARSGDFIVINIPYLCDDEEHDPLHRKLGETLCPSLGFDTKYAIDTQKQVGKKVWEALYQGHPSIDGGQIFIRNTFKYYDKKTLPSSFEEMKISCDLSFGGTKKSNDPCAIQVWGRVGANHYLLKRIKKRMTFNEMCEMIKVVSATYPLARTKLVEKKANGQAVMQSLNSLLGGFKEIEPGMEDKVSRANAVTPYFESGNIFFPCKEIDPTIDEMEEELCKFPNSAHDDEVDAMTQYLNDYSYKHSGRVCTDSYYKRLNNAFRGIKI